MFSLLTTAARAALLPAAFSGPWAVVLVPVLLYAVTQRDVSVTMQLR